MVKSYTPIAVIKDIRPQASMLVIARLWDRSDSRLLQWISEGPDRLSGEVRVAAILPSQEVTAEDYLVFQSLAVQPIFVPEALSEASPVEVEAFVLEALAGARLMHECLHK